VQRGSVGSSNLDSPLRGDFSQQKSNEENGAKALVNENG